MNQSGRFSTSVNSFIDIFKSRKNLINIVILLVFLYIIIPQLGSFKQSLGSIKNLNYIWLILGFLFSMLTYLMSALSYYVLAIKPIIYGKTILTQGASMFANHLLPSGIGSLGVSYKYLRKNHHNNNEALAIVYINNLLGFIGYLTILLLILLFTNTPIKINISTSTYKYTGLVITVTLLVILIFIYKYEKYRKIILNSFKQIHVNIYAYRHKKIRLLIAFLAIIGLTVLYSFSFYASAKAVGFTVSITQALVILAIGVVGKTVAPTPGGIIGAEAGLFAGLIAYGSTSPEAIIIILTYRLLTYWIPFGLGIFAFSFVRQKEYI